MRNYKQYLKIAKWAFIVFLICVAGGALFSDSPVAGILGGVMMLALLSLPVLLLLTLWAYVDEKVRGAEEDKAEMVPRREKKQAGWFAHFMLLLFLFVIGSIFFEATYNSSAKANTPDNVEVYAMAESIVEQKLKAPRTAKFCGYTQAKVINYEPNKYTVLNCVDAENSFGAMIRSNFEVSLEWKGNGQWQVINVDIN